MNYKKWFLAGIVGGIAYWLLSFIVNILVGGIWPYDIFSLGGMRSVSDPVMALYFVHPFVLALAMAFVYQKVAPILKGTVFQKGMQFGWIIWPVAGLPSAFMVYTTMNYPIGFTVQSIFGTLLGAFAAAIVIAKLSE
ncbi:MAG: hypothetical protein V1777_03675 [Candidatus Micrarchaeota archaeon]